MDLDTVDICVVEDDASERSLLTQRLLRRDYTVVSAEDGPTGLQLIYRHRPKVIVCDVALPDLDGIEICRRVRSDPTLDGVYLILVTAHNSSARKTAALSAGADDYLSKPYDPDELWARIRNGMRIHRLQERLQRAALTDGLTDLWNHTQFRHLLDVEFARTRRYGGPVRCRC
jgi:sigma-B regulation protein RsbU (phosphoserine phosphatase)